jgi:hypothetical protein
MEKCPLCDHLNEDEEAGVKHLIYAHLMEPLPSIKRTFCVWWRDFSLVCLCGQHFRMDLKPGMDRLDIVVPPRYLHHLKLKGGLVNHVMEVTLNLDKKRRT